MMVERVLAAIAPSRTTPTKKAMQTVLTITATTEAIEYRKSRWTIGVRNFSRMAGIVIATGGQATGLVGANRDRPDMMAS
jgi:general stress protein CsbA